LFAILIQDAHFARTDFSVETVQWFARLIGTEWVSQ
jgi:hypothetical protein